MTWARRLPETALSPSVAAFAPDAAPGVLQFGPMRIKRDLVETVVRAARDTDTDPTLLMAIADKESAFAPAVKASTSSATGLFQFLDSTWLRVVRDFGSEFGLEKEAAAIDSSDGRLSFMGMPCPNLFTGEMGIHSKLEYVSVQDMEKAVEVCVNLAQIWEEKSI